MTNRYSLSATEAEIMDFLWQSDRIYTTTELLAQFNNIGKNWKRQTLNTLIVRLENKGLVRREGKLVYPHVDFEEYRQLQSQEMLDIMYGGKVGNFISALIKTDVSNTDIESLDRMIEKMKKGN